MMSGQGFWRIFCFGFGIFRCDKRVKVKYTVVSLLATAADFTVFSMLSLLLASYYVVVATLLGMASGAMVSWTLNRLWVFPDSDREHSVKRRLYFSGVLLSVFLNVALMWLLVSCLFLPQMACRLPVATAVWAVLFWFNRRVVFNL